MNEELQNQIVAIISIVGFLALVLTGWRTHKLERGRAIYMAGIWAGIFAITILAFSVLGI